mmetsp:Transcript_23343/g.66490  ORF Transcript_23343/g.66490 Transcript_23343/m.66490 type:complete len:261 (-) Transcript_23343:872-1654(-)
MTPSTLLRTIDTRDFVAIMSVWPFSWPISLSSEPVVGLSVLVDLRCCSARLFATETLRPEDPLEPPAGSLSPSVARSLRPRASSSSLDSPAWRMPRRQSVGPTSWFMTTQPMIVAAAPLAQGCLPTKPICICATSPSVTPDWLCSVIQRWLRTTAGCRVAAEAAKLPSAMATKRRLKSTGGAAALRAMASRSSVAPAMVKKGGITKGAMSERISRKPSRLLDTWLAQIAPIMQTSRGSTRRRLRASGASEGMAPLSLTRP